MVPEDLQLFLDGALPKVSKRSKTTLGVSDAKLGAAISEVLGIPCTHIGAVPEIVRGKSYLKDNNKRSMTAVNVLIYIC